MKALILCLVRMLGCATEQEAQRGLEFVAQDMKVEISQDTQDAYLACRRETAARLRALPKQGRNTALLLTRGALKEHRRVCVVVRGR